MSWTYNASPFIFGQEATAQNMIDTVRFLLGDTSSTDPQLQDSEITGLLMGTCSSPNAQPMNWDPFQAAIAGCVGLAGMYSRRSNKTTGDLSVQSSDVAKHYMDLRQQIKLQARRYTTPVPYAGGLRYSDLEVDRQDDDLLQPNFSVGMDDNHDTTSDLNTRHDGYGDIPTG